MNPPSIAELRAICERATPGPWKCQIPAMTGEWPTGKIKPLKIKGRLYGHPMLPINDAEYIAALNPSTVKALLDDLERMREALGFYSGAANYWDMGATFFDVDKGEKAREALASLSVPVVSNDTVGRAE